MDPDLVQTTASAVAHHPAPTMDSLLPIISLVVTGIIIPLVGIVWKQSKDRIDAMERRIKETQVEMNIRVDKINDERKKNIDKLFDKIDDMASANSTSLEGIKEELSELSTEVAVIKAHASRVS